MMSRQIFRPLPAVLLLFACASWALGQDVIDGQVRDLLSRMTLEEKVGQMTQVTVDVVSLGADGRQEPHQLDMAKLDTALLRYHVGSIINVGPQAYSLDHWQEVITAIQNVAMRKTRLKIPVLYGIDAVHGVNYTHGATLFPQAINMAATFNTDLVREEGSITASEMRASGIPWNFYPVLDLGRQPLWPRLWETYGEDVHLSAAMGKAYVQGHQGTDVSAPGKGGVCLKHYVGYSFPMSGKDRTAAWISERMMREYFLPAFEEAVKAGAPSVMVNSGEVDGIPGHANYHLLTEILKGEMQFKGFVVSDWADIIRLHTRDRVAVSPKDAVRMAVMAGIDMSMVPLDYSFSPLLLECVKDGSVPVSRIDDAVSRILRVKLQLGLFKDPYPDVRLKSGFASAQHTAVNLKAAEESIVLVKNDGVLPLRKSAQVLVTGPTADALSPMNSGWTITWQGDQEQLYPTAKPTILKAIREKIGADHVTYVPGATFDRTLDIPNAVKAASGVDAVVVCLGERAYCETPGNIDNLTLDAAQLELTAALQATGKPVVVVMIEGRPRIIEPIVDRAPGILIGFLPGIEGGRAVANLLFGDAVPSGKLSVTYPRFPNALMCYDHKPADAAEGNVYNPQWPFGFGLSYTTFAYADLKLDRTVIRSGESLGVSLTVRNTGSIAGAEAVLLYLNDNYGTVSRPARQLKAFTKVYLKPGEQQTVRFTLLPASLSFIGTNNTRIIERGGFTASVGSMSQSFVLE